MADPIVFLPPHFMDTKEAEHYRTLRRLSDHDLTAYLGAVRKASEDGKLKEGWRLQQVEAERNRRS